MTRARVRETEMAEIVELVPDQRRHAEDATERRERFCFVGRRAGYGLAHRMVVVAAGHLAY
jgi:hypothetical protein